jgi:uncharacterized membrane protein YjgN (DUF898 family)
MTAAVSRLSETPSVAATGAVARSVPSGNSASVLPMIDPRETKFVWTGSPWLLLGPCIFNGFMMLVTLGVYSFWGRTEIRRRMWASVRLDGEPLVYHGSGLELFKGFVAAMLLVLLPIFLLSTVMVVAYGQASQSWATYQMALFVVVYPVLKALAQYRARRFRLARTSWRGIRGSLVGSSSEFAFLSWATSLLYPLTLGWIAPWRALYVQRFLVGDTMLGDRRLRLGGSTAKLYMTFSVLWIGTVVLCFVAFYGIGKILGPEGYQLKSQIDFLRITRLQWIKVGGVIFAAMFVWSLIGSFYRATLYNMIANATLIRPPDGSGLPLLRFKLTTRGPQLIWLFVTNQLLTYGSLFVLKPIATARSMQYFVQNLAIVGAFDPANLRQNPNATVSEGEGLAQAFDFDAF